MIDVATNDIIHLSSKKGDKLCNSSRDFSNPKTLKWSSNCLIAGLTEKKKRGRPFAGEKPKNMMLRIRIDEDIKAKLEAQKKRTGKTMSQIVIELIEQLDD